jgi:hypothetical protein
MQVGSRNFREYVIVVMPAFLASAMVALAAAMLCALALWISGRVPLQSILIGSGLVGLTAFVTSILMWRAGEHARPCEEALNDDNWFLPRAKPVDTDASGGIGAPRPAKQVQLPTLEK